MDTESVLWTSNLGHRLISKVELRIGGDDKPYSYCQECGARFETQPEGSCSTECSRFSQERFDAVCSKIFPFLDEPEVRSDLDTKFQTDYQFMRGLTAFTELLSEEQRSEWQARLDDVEEELMHEMGREQQYFSIDLDRFLKLLLPNLETECMEYWLCDSTKFTQNQREGSLIDVHYGDWLNIWNQPTSDKN